MKELLYGFNWHMI